MRVSPWWLLIGSLLVIGVAVSLADWVEVTEDVGFGSKARRNPYLAAERFLAGVGVEVRRAEGLTALDVLPPATDTLLLASARRSLSESRVERLLDWVRSGGRLIVSADGVEMDDAGAHGDRLLDALEVTVLVDQRDVPVPAPAVEGDRRQPAGVPHGGACSFPGGVTLLNLDGEPQPLLAGLDGSRFLAYLGSRAAEAHLSEIGPQMVELAFGQGEAVVLTTLAPWRNERIGCADHAHVLRWLGRDRGTLWWLANTEMEALPVLLWQRFPLAIVLGVVLVGLWAWRQGFRIAGAVAGPLPQRRQLMEHVEGVARYRFRRGEADSLLAPLRAAVLAEAPENLQESFVPELARRSRVQVRALTRSLFGSPGSDVQEFTEAVRILQVARREQRKENSLNE
jgi:hypothetical protein